MLFGQKLLFLSRFFLSFFFFFFSLLSSSSSSPFSLLLFLLLVQYTSFSIYNPSTPPPLLPHFPSYASESYTKICIPSPLSAEDDEQAQIASHLRRIESVVDQHVSKIAAATRYAPQSSAQADYGQRAGLSPQSSTHAAQHAAGRAAAGASRRAGFPWDSRYQGTLDANAASEDVSRGGGPGAPEGDRGRPVDSSAATYPSAAVVASAASAPLVQRSASTAKLQAALHPTQVPFATDAGADGDDGGPFAMLEKKLLEFNLEKDLVRIVGWGGVDGQMR